MSLQPPFESPLAALRAAVSKIGSQSATARLLGVSQAAVWGWLNEGTELPAKHVIPIEHAVLAETGISRHDLRPDLYPREDGTAPHHDLEPA